ncbi:MAG: hypothetical protein CMF22_11795 [Idiomarinaceae bacterium]|nr:hypothetical protein [Idiomarinaceae bacterium]|tara:strand:+ start:41200 stop:41772 length:573 start_codon:yes stop_codon:yes gene_type:complete
MFNTDNMLSSPCIPFMGEDEFDQVKFDMFIDAIVTAIQGAYRLYPWVSHDSVVRQQIERHAMPWLQSNGKERSAPDGVPELLEFTTEHTHNAVVTRDGREFAPMFIISDRMAVPPYVTESISELSHDAVLLGVTNDGQIVARSFMVDRERLSQINIERWSVDNPMLIWLGDDDRVRLMDNLKTQHALEQL